MKGLRDKISARGYISVDVTCDCCGRTGWLEFYLNERDITVDGDEINMSISMAKVEERIKYDLGWEEDFNGNVLRCDSCADLYENDGLPGSGTVGYGD